MPQTNRKAPDESGQVPVAIEALIFAVQARGGERGIWHITDTETGLPWIISVVSGQAENPEMDIAVALLGLRNVVAKLVTNKPQYARTAAEAIQYADAFIDQVGGPTAIQEHAQYQMDTAALLSGRPN